MLKRMRKSSEDALNQHARLQLKEKYPTPPSSTSQKPEHHRTCRVVLIVAQFMIVIAIAISPYFIGASFVESDISNGQDNILHHEKDLGLDCHGVHYVCDLLVDFSSYGSNSR